MGAADFSTIALGKSAADAFNAAVSEAQYEYGHGGYTGSIAEKGGDGFIQFTVKARTNPFDVLSKCMDAQVALWYEQDPTSEYVRKPKAVERNALAWLRERVSIVEAPRENRYGTGFGYPSRPRDAATAMSEAANDKWGACCCIEITGAKAAQIKAKYRRKGTHDKVFLFFGSASC